MSTMARETINNSSNATIRPYKPTPRDYVFLDLIGEGSFSTVFKARSASDPRRLYAIKICEKTQIKREKKSHLIHREKDALNLLSGSSRYFIQLYCTFQDNDRLYFVMTYAPNGELLKFIRRGVDVTCARFYAGEILMALEYLHNKGIVHRDLKPENILFSQTMHILISDFGSCHIENDPRSDGGNSSADSANSASRRKSFVGTAQYVSPEMLNGVQSSNSSDIWALGCILYQMVTGTIPFHATSEHTIFRKITQDPPDYMFPSNFDPDARSLVEKILVADPKSRLGVDDFNQGPKGEGEYTSIRQHPFFQPLSGRWETLHEETAPLIIPEPCDDNDFENLSPGFDEGTMARLILKESKGDTRRTPAKDILDPNDPEFERRLEAQRRNNEYHRFVENNLILRQGKIEKRKGLFARSRMFLLTTGPRLYYVDPLNKVLKGQVPWSADLHAEAKNFKTFYVHTPGRTYYLEDPEGDAPGWVTKIEELKRKYFPNGS